MTDEVTVTIRVDGGPMPIGMFDQMMCEQGVTVVSRTAGVEERGWESVVGDAAAIADLGVLVVKGSLIGIRAALERYRRRFPKATVEAEDEVGNPIGYL